MTQLTDESPSQNSCLHEWKGGKSFPVVSYLKQLHAKINILPLVSTPPAQNAKACSRRGIEN